MTRYLVARLGSGLVTLFLFVTLLVFLVNVVVPGDYVSQFILTAEQAQDLRESLGIDRSLPVQYLDWLGTIVSLDLGASLGGGDVWELIAGALPSTLLVLTIGLSIAFVLGGWLGRVSAYQDSTFTSGALTFVAILFLTAFPPALAVVMEDVLGTGARLQRPFLIRLH